ncbi:MAG: hypothetical protein P8Y54_00730 [Xanthomonadales bacterium]
MMSKLMRATAMVALLSWAVGLSAQQAPSAVSDAARAASEIVLLERKAAEARSQENWSELYESALKLHEQRPHVPSYMIEIIRASAAMGERQRAYEYMLKLQQSGLSYDMTRIPQTAEMRDSEAFQHINNLMLEANKPMGVGKDFLSLPGRPADIGDLAWDASRERFLLGTRREGRIMTVADDGSTEILLEANDENGLWSIGGLAVDVDNNALWVASSATPAFARYSTADAHRSALFRFDLETLELLERYNLGADGLPHRFGGVAATSDGTVYVLDRALPFIFRKAADGDRIEPFVAMPKLVGLSDFAVTPDNSRLFVVDPVMGILAIDPAAGHSTMLRSPENLNLFGIYSIEYADGSLVVTQSGIRPQRIMRFVLDAAGAGIQSVVPMAVALEQFDTPGTGVIRGDSLYFFANQGTRSDDDRMRMMVSPLDSGEQLVTPDMRVFERMMRERAKMNEEKPDTP